MTIIDGDICPFCNRAYDWYCHEHCEKTKKLIDKLRNSYNSGNQPSLSYDELKFIIDALEGLYEGGNP